MLSLHTDQSETHIISLYMKEKVIAVYDIGKTNKKIILFNYDLKPVSEIEEKFAETRDDDGFECDDIEHIEKWIRDSIIQTDSFR